MSDIARDLIEEWTRLQALKPPFEEILVWERWGDPENMAICSIGGIDYLVMSTAQWVMIRRESQVNHSFDAWGIFGTRMREVEPGSDLDAKLQAVMNEISISKDRNWGLSPGP